MATNTLASLIDRLSQRVGDYLDITLTTALTTSANVVSTNFGKYTNRDSTYNRFWLYVEDFANAAQYRKISTYTNSTTTAVVLGANFVSDGANMATVQIHKYDRDNKMRAINQAARKIWPNLFRFICNDDLVANNALPNGRFTDWAVSTYPDYWRVTNCTATATTTVGSTRGGTKSAKVLNTSANGYMSVSSDQFPFLLDLSDRTITFKAWAYPEVADDATIEIYTLKADGTAQTITSTTTCPAGKWSLLKLEDKQINDDIQYIQFRCKVTTNSKYAYFANARVDGMNVHNYVLPLDYQNSKASINTVSYQATGSADDPCDDLGAYTQFAPLHGWTVRDYGTARYLSIHTLPDLRMIRLEGTAPLESNLSAATDVMTIDDPYIDLLIEYAAHLLFDMEAGLPSSQDRDFLRSESIRYLLSYKDMRGDAKMAEPQVVQKFDWRIL